MPVYGAAQPGMYAPPGMAMGQPAMNMGQPGMAMGQQPGMGGMGMGMQMGMGQAQPQYGMAQQPQQGYRT